MEMDRAGNEHHVHPAGKHFLVRIEADVTMVGRHGNLIGLGLQELSEAALELRREQVRQGN